MVYFAVKSSKYQKNEKEEWVAMQIHAFIGLGTFTALVKTSSRMTLTDTIVLPTRMDSFMFHGLTELKKSMYSECSG